METSVPGAPRVDFYSQNQTAQASSYKDCPPPSPVQQSLSSEFYALQNQFISFVEQTAAEVNALKTRVNYLESRLG